MERHIQVPIPEGNLKIIVADGPEFSNRVTVIEVLEGSPMAGKLFVGDAIVGFGRKAIKTVNELSSLLKERSHTGSFLEVLTPRAADSEIEEKDNDVGIEEASVVEPTFQEEESDNNELLHIDAPAGKLGIKLNSSLEVIDMLSNSPLSGEIRIHDRVVKFDGVDVRKKDSRSLLELLMASSQERKRTLVILRASSATIAIPTRKVVITEEKEMNEKFPNLSHFNIPLGKELSDMSTRRRLLSELLSYDHSNGIMNETITTDDYSYHITKRRKILEDELPSLPGCPPQLVQLIWDDFARQNNRLGKITRGKKIALLWERTDEKIKMTLPKEVDSTEYMQDLLDWKIQNFGQRTPIPRKNKIMTRKKK